MPIRFGQPRRLPVLASRRQCRGAQLRPLQSGAPGAPGLADSELGERRIDPIELQTFAALYRKRLGYFLPPVQRR